MAKRKEQTIENKQQKAPEHPSELSAEEQEHLTALVSIWQEELTALVEGKQSFSSIEAVVEFLVERVAEKIGDDSPQLREHLKLLLDIDPELQDELKTLLNIS